MHSSSTFHLEWSNHLGNMQAVLESLYMHQSLVDVTIACRDGILKAHKVILSACSPYFEAVFRETPCKHPVLILKGVSVREMQALLRFMYRGQVDVPEADLNTLVATACEFKVKGFAVDAMRGGPGDSRPDSPSDHESENEALSERIQNRAASRQWKLKKSEKNVNKADNMSNLADEMSVTPVIVESQSLVDNVPGEKGEDEEETGADEKKDRKDDEDTQKENENSQKSTEDSQPTAEGSRSPSGAAVGNSEAAPFRRETRYKGQKRVDVGIRSSLGRTRSADKRESSMGVEVRPSSSSSSSQLTKKQRTVTVTHKMDLSPDSEAVAEDQNSNNADDRNTMQESHIADMTISACAAEDGPMQYVKIKAEAESAEEEEEEEEATADMFCIPHLQEMPDTDSLDPSTSAPEGLDLSANQWAQPPVSLSGREQRNIPETTAEEGEGDMACPYCFTRCPKFSDLKRHMRLHTEDKPHECEFCSLAFARASHLARHRRTHTGERPFHCPDPSCERTFSRQDKLKLHTQRAHPNLPCDVVQSGTIMRIRGRRRIRDKQNMPLGLRLGIAPPRAALNAGRPPAGALSHAANPLSPAVISLPFGDTSYLTSLSLGQQRYSDLTISPVTPGGTNSASNAGMANSGAGAEELLKSVRQLGECTIQTLPSKVLAE